MKRNPLTKLISLICLALPTLSIAGTDISDTETDKALSLAPNLENGKRIYRTCALCHTPEGWGSESGRFPQIAGQHANITMKQLADIRANNRDNPTMLPFTQGRILSGAQAIADVSAYIEQLPMTPANGLGPGRNLEYGKQLYQQNCTKCHGENGEGDPEKFIPRIQGQHFAYVKRQMKWIKKGKRRNADDKMVKQLKGFNHQDIKAIADYTSRLKPENSMLAEPGWRNPDFKNGILTAPRIQQNILSTQ